MKWTLPYIHEFKAQGNTFVEEFFFPFVTLESFNIVENCLTGGTESESDNEGNRLDEKQFFNIAELGQKVKVNKIVIVWEESFCPILLEQKVKVKVSPSLLQYCWLCSSGPLSPLFSDAESGFTLIVVIRYDMI